MTDPPTILIADDDPDILALVAYRLQQAGYAVVTASDGQTALDLAATHTPALAVLDVMMPNVDGYRVTEALRAQPETSRIPILLLTARVHDADVERGLAAGADDYVRKPFSPQELVLRIGQALGGR